MTANKKIEAKNQGAAFNFIYLEIKSKKEDS
jgi:hypothetical protein